MIGLRRAASIALVRPTGCPMACSPTKSGRCPQTTGQCHVEFAGQDACDSARDDRMTVLPRELACIGAAVQMSRGFGAMFQWKGRHHDGSACGGSPFQFVHRAIPAVGANCASRFRLDQDHRWLWSCDFIFPGKKARVYVDGSGPAIHARDDCLISILSGSLRAMASRSTTDCRASRRASCERERTAAIARRYVMIRPKPSVISGVSFSNKQSVTRDL